MDRIFGIGTDIVNTLRIKKIFSTNKRFKKLARVGSHIFYIDKGN